MSAITIENDLVHYEVLGRGRPVILLHGWLGSWRYWIPAMQQLSMKYRTYALDLWGYGDSGKDARRYGFEAQVMLLDQFMEKMGITKAALVGHGLGAAIAARYAVRFPDRVPRLMTVSPPVFRMAPPVNPLTTNPPPQLSLSETAPKLPEIPALNTGSTVTPGQTSALPPVNPEAETIPWRSDEMKARIRAALDRQVQQQAEDQRTNGVSLPAAPGGPKSPREAAVPPAETPAAPPLPEPLAEIPAMPKADLAEVRDIQIQQPNPLKDHLGVLDAVALLEKHVEAGADQDKLKAEVSKADKSVLALSVESFAGIDTLRDLKTLNMPTVVVYGSNDTFVPPPDAEMVAALREGRSTFQLIGMDDTRHFPMLENIAPFTRLLLDFLEIPDVTKLEIKKTWERRVR
jgi:pimeloyl-ACP methyl ester carboxylesterase